MLEITKKRIENNDFESSDDDNDDDLKYNYEIKPTRSALSESKCYIFLYNLPVFSVMHVHFMCILCVFYVNFMCILLQWKCLFESK